MVMIEILPTFSTQESLYSTMNGCCTLEISSICTNSQQSKAASYTLSIIDKLDKPDISFVKCIICINILLHNHSQKKLQRNHFQSEQTKTIAPNFIHILWGVTFEIHVEFQAISHFWCQGFVHNSCRICCLESSSSSSCVMLLYTIFGALRHCDFH